MGSKNGAQPNGMVAQIKNTIAIPKAWVASGEIEWVDTGGRPCGYKFRQPLALANGLQPAGLFVEGYFKAATVPGAADKLSLSLFVHSRRVFGIDEDGFGGHYNSVGVGRRFYGQRVGFPHIHTVSDEAIEGYAEPIDRVSLEDYWKTFTNEMNIIGAPSFKLPIQQLGLTV